MREVSPFRLGSRGSLLARAQSHLIAGLFAETCPDVDVSLVYVSTRGDEDRTTPLTDIDDEQFFSAELDNALLNGDVDFCVHSLKDLPRKPAAGIARIALPARADPRDVIIFRGDIRQRLELGNPIRIGSSSRRRQLNVSAFLSDALPSTGPKPDIRFAPLRGPVDERLRRVALEASDRDALDGVILALAGLERLWNDSRGRAATEPLLRDKRWMVLPLTVCPTAPGQGVLAIECREGDTAICNALARLHDGKIANQVASERASVDSLPERDRTAAAATNMRIDPVGPITFFSRPGHAPRVNWSAPPKPERAVPWDGQRLFPASELVSTAVPDTLIQSEALFIAHWYAAMNSLRIDDSTRIWVSGFQSWRKLAERGLWIEGCADNLGFRNITPTLATDVLQLPPLADWTVLTAEQAVPGWAGAGINNVLATYRRAPLPTTQHEMKFQDDISRATHFFWGSAHQYVAAAEWLPRHAQHFCGPGKTADALRRLGVANPYAFPSRKAWQEWLA